MTITTKSMLRYPGGKTRAIKVLAPLVPKSTNKVVSPFLGGGSFELYLTSLGIEVTASDLFPQLVDFWTVMDENPHTLADSLDLLIGTVDKEMFHDFQKHLRHEERTPKDIATWFYAVNRCSFSGATLSGGYSKAAAEGRFTPSSVDRVRNYHNDLLTVSCKEYKDAVEQDTDMLFLDPPYLLGGSRDSLYGNKGDLHDSFNHVEFRDIIKDRNVPSLITYNNTPEIHELWNDDQWNLREVSWSYGMNATKKSSEVVITNYPLE